VLPEAILLRVRVELHCALRQVLALPRLDGRRSVCTAGDAGQRHPGEQADTEPHGDEPHATF